MSTLKGFLAEQNVLSDEENRQHTILNCKKAVQQICSCRLATPGGEKFDDQILLPQVQIG